MMLLVMSKHMQWLAHCLPMPTNKGCTIDIDIVIHVTVNMIDMGVLWYIALLIQMSTSRLETTTKSAPSWNSKWNYNGNSNDWQYNQIKSENDRKQNQSRAQTHFVWRERARLAIEFRYRSNKTKFNLMNRFHSYFEQSKVIKQTQMQIGNKDFGKNWMKLTVQTQSNIRMVLPFALGRWNIFLSSRLFKNKNKFSH